MNRTVVMLVLFAAASGSLAFADPPAPGVPVQSPGGADQKSRADTIQPDRAVAAATAPADTTAAKAPAAGPTASAADEARREALLLDQGYKPTMRNGEKVFCKRETPMGSRLPTALHCLTVAEAELIAKEGRETTERIQRNSVGCLNPSTGGCGK